MKSHPRLHHLAARLLLAACGKSSTSVVVPKVTSVVVSPATPSVEVGLSLQFTAAATDANGAPITGQTVTWSSSSETVASIDTNGLATGLSAGFTQIRATVDGVQSSPATLTVTASSCTARTDVVLSPGQYASFPGDACLLLPAGTLGDVYRVAVARPKLVDDSTNVASVTLNMSLVLSTVSAGPDAQPPFPAAVARGESGLPLLDGTRALEHLRRSDATRAFEMQLRRRELELGLGRASVLPSRAPSAPALVDPPATDSLFVSLDCGIASPIRRPVTRVGFSDNLVIYQLTSEFSTSPISSTAAGIMLNYYESYVKDMIVAYWGAIPDADGNGRIIVVTTTALDSGVAAAVYSGDYYSLADCPSSNEGEVIYFDGSLIRELDPADPNTDPYALGVVAHEAKHVISLYNGFLRGGTNLDFHDLWVEEGTADISSEMSSRIAWAATGGPAVNAPITRSAIIAGLVGGKETPEMSALIDHLAGIVRSLSSQPNSVITDPVGDAPGHSFYHMSWHWHRFLGDGFGDAASFAQADSALFHLLSSPSTPAGGAAEELQVTGAATFDALFEDFVVAVSLHGSGFPAPHPIETWSFVSAGDVFSNPNPTGSYPWPVTATDTNQWALYGTASYSGGIGPSGVRFHDFRSSGSAAAEIRVSGAADGVIVVTRLD